MFKGLQETKIKKIKNKKKKKMIHGYDSIQPAAMKLKRGNSQNLLLHKKRQTQGQLRQHGFQPNSYNPTNQPRQ